MNGLLQKYLHIIKTWLTHNIIEFAINHVLDRWTESIHQTDIVYFHQLTTKDYGRMVREYHNHAYLFVKDDKHPMGDIVYIQIITYRESNQYKSQLMMNIEKKYPSTPFWIKIACWNSLFSRANYIVAKEGKISKFEYFGGTYMLPGSCEY